MKIVQLLVGQMAVFAYVVGCEKTGEALVIDPAGDMDGIVEQADKHGFKIVKIVNTHSHPDHTCGNYRMKELTQAPVIVHADDADSMCSSHNLEFARMLGCSQLVPADQTVVHGDKITVGEEVELTVLHTPGHSPGCMCLYTPGHVFTGDTLFVGGVGRTDLPGGSWAQMLSSIQERILTLPPDTKVWPGHHYGAAPSSTVAQEKSGNPYL
jgi:glyoxylase-like metal-dependent hydrolase (beta-lactamase superfamily II)